MLPDRSAVQRGLDGVWGREPAAVWAEFAYDFLHHGLIRRLIAWIGAKAGMEALYWRGGVHAHETTTGGHVLIAQYLTESDWRGTIRVETKGAQAERLREMVTAWIGRENETHHLTAMLTQSSPERAALGGRDTPMPDFTPAEPPPMTEYFVSYAWNDRAPGGPEREKDVDRLCAEAAARGITLHRDKTDIQMGDSIAKFMRRLAGGSRVFVVLSDKYLRSVGCMTELYEIWLDCRGKDAEILKRIRVYALPGTPIYSVLHRIEAATWWKEQHDTLEAAVNKAGASVLSTRSLEEFRRMRAFVSHVDDILSLIADTLHPRTFDDLVKHGLDGD